MSDTPETDAAQFGTGRVSVGFARKLERERDAAIEHWEEVREYGTDEINASVDLRQKLAQALVELDNMQDQRDLAMKVISKLERERDEALSQIVQAECRAERFCQERDELIDKNKKLNEEVDDLIRQRPLLIEDFKRERDEAREKIERQADRIRYLEGATNHAEGTPLSVALKERDEARNAIVGWENKWKCAIDMAARASLERDAALNKLKELKDILR